LYAEYAWEMTPCPLCIFQRVGFIVMGVFFLLGALHAPRGGQRLDPQVPRRHHDAEHRTEPHARGIDPAQPAARRMQGAKQKEHAHHDEADALEDAQRARRHFPGIFGIQREAHEGGAHQETDGETEAVRPAQWVHRGFAAMRNDDITRSAQRCQHATLQQPRRRTGVGPKTQNPAPGRVCMTLQATVRSSGRHLTPRRRTRPADGPPARRTPSARCRRRGSRT
ncbi:MAG: disulfide bond formation protein B, partial [Rhodanobacter sp.]|nr:disulfide bond formation protein B [Rhodanobacter sp.]